MLKIVIAALIVLVLGKAIIVALDALDHAGRVFVRVVLALCVTGFAVAAGALASLAVDHVLGDVTVLRLSGGRWAGIATTCLLLALAIYRHSRDEREATPLAAEWERPRSDPVALAPAVAFSLPRPAGPWWSPAARRAKKASRDEFARAEAWDQFALHANWAAARIAVARSACEGFLRDLPAEPGLLESELAVALRRRVPEIIAEAVEACASTPSEARALADEGVELLEMLAAEAERRRPAFDRGTASRFATKRAYVEEVVRRGRPS